ncbi:MAG: glutathione S-transferase, partial [Steroidobacteraceae bacterium]|nr:glutathione S-transferase [Steroidobacteraceae bacterium]
MTDAPITFWHNPMSRGRIVHWMLEETGAPYEVRLLNLEKNEQKSPAYLAINPMGKVPAIVHRGVVVTESAAICTYLADAFPKAGLAPAPEDPARGTYLRWMFFAAGCMEPALIDKMFGRPPVERKGAVGWGSYEDVLNALETAIKPGPYVLGERFSAADVYVGSVMQ